MNNAMHNEQQLYRATQFIWYLFYVLEVLLLFRFILKLFGANEAAAFTNFVYTLSSVPLVPFQFVFGTNNIGGSVFEWSALFAMLAYWFIAWGIILLVHMSRPVGWHEAKHKLNTQENI